MDIIVFTFFFVLIFSFVSLSFLTLMERKLLGLMHLRLGPNKTFLFGIFQPFADALKLFLKSKGFLFKSSLLVYFMSPLFMLFVFLINYTFVFFSEYIINFNYSILILMITFSFSIYFFIMGYFSGSSYSFLGSWRCLVQMISYEIVLFFLIIYMYMFKSSYSIFYSLYFHYKGFTVFFIFPIWLLIFLVESGRIPFDLLEGESELVSGFNVEYWGGEFSLIFMYEYGMLIYISLFTSLMFSMGFFSYFVFFMLLGFFIIVRGLLPRFRYDIMLMFTWKFLFPLTMGLVLFLLI